MPSGSDVARVVEPERGAVALDEGGGEGGLGELFDLLERVSHRRFVDVFEGALAEDVATDVLHLEEVEERVAQVRFVVECVGHYVFGS